MLQAIRATGVTPLARVPWLEPGIIMKALDAGAMGIICPMVNNRADAEALVSYMRYPPLGQRSFGPTRAAVADPGYGVEANGEVLAMAMIETADGVRNLEEICATPGLDGVYVGPADLTLGTQQGRLPPALDREEPEMIEIIRRIADVCRANGIKAGIHCGTPDYAFRAIEWGYEWTTVAADSRLLAAAAGASVASNGAAWSGRDSAEVKSREHLLMPAAAEKPPLRIGLIGTGYMGKAHVFGYATAEKVSWACRSRRFCTRSPTSRRSLRPAPPTRSASAALDDRLAHHDRRSRDRRDPRHHAQRAAQGDVARGHRRGQARPLREAARNLGRGRARDDGGGRGRRRQDAGRLQLPLQPDDGASRRR